MMKTGLKTIYWNQAGTNSYIFMQFRGKIEFPNTKISRFLLWISMRVYGISAGVGPLDMSNIALWVLVCVRDMNAKHFAFKVKAYKSKFFLVD